MRTRLRNVMPLVVGLGLFIAALLVLHRLLGEFRGHEILPNSGPFPPGRWRCRPGWRPPAIC